VCVVTKSSSYSLLTRMWLIIVLRNAASAPGRMRAYMSAVAEVRVYRGSTWMSFAPFSWATRIHLKAIGWFSATLLPSTRIVCACCRSIQWFVIAPRPNAAPRPGTVGLCQSRAWCSTNGMPSNRAAFWKR
jgi:hypothetical protein